MEEGHVIEDLVAGERNRVKGNSIWNRLLSKEDIRTNIHNT